MSINQPRTLTQGPIDQRNCFLLLQIAATGILSGLLGKCSLKVSGLGTYLTLLRSTISTTSIRPKVLSHKAPTLSYPIGCTSYVLSLVHNAQQNIAFSTEVQYGLILSPDQLSDLKVRCATTLHAWWLTYNRDEIKAQTYVGMSRVIRE
jgi:hypothetical protein